MISWLSKFVFLAYAFVSVIGQEDEWIDPYNMTHYDSTSKTMRKIPEVPKKADTESPIRDWNQDENHSRHVAECSKKLSMLQSAIEDIKHKASVLKQQPGFVSTQNHKLNQLLTSIEQLRMPQKDDFCQKSWLSTYLEEARRYISVGLLIAATHFTNLTDVLSQPDVTCWLVPVGCLVTFLVLFVCTAVKWRQGRDRREENRENDLQNDNRGQECQEGDRDNLEAQDEGQELGPPVEDLGPEQAEGRSASEPPQQGPDASEDECCDENNSITKTPVTETEPDTQHFAE